GEPEIHQDRNDRQRDERRIPPRIERERGDGGRDDGRVDAPRREREVKQNRDGQEEKNEFRRIEKHLLELTPIGRSHGEPPPCGSSSRRSRPSPRSFASRGPMIRFIRSSPTISTRCSMRILPAICCATRSRPRTG